MKKLTALKTLTLGSATLLASSVSAFAADSVKPCASGVGSLCNPNSNSLGDLIARVIDYLLIGAAIIAVIFLIWGGIRWIMSGGDKAKVEAARNTVIGAIIGLIIVFAAYFIIDVVLHVIFGFDIQGGFNIPSLF